MELKYIRGRMGFAIFDAGQKHSDMARGMYEKPVSAGMCTIAVGYKSPSEYELGEENVTVSVHCYGKSVTLGLESKEEDEKYIQDQITRYY